MEPSPRCGELRLQETLARLLVAFSSHCNLSWGRSQASCPELGVGSLVCTRAQACTWTDQGRGPEVWLGHPHPAPISSRATPGKARLDEVMAAAALTSLSTSPLLLGAPVAAFSPGKAQMSAFSTVGGDRAQNLQPTQPLWGKQNPQTWDCFLKWTSAPSVPLTEAKAAGPRPSGLPDLFTSTSLATHIC